METIRIGIIGGGLMGREFASAAARWCHLQNPPAAPVITAIASRTKKSCEWFEQNIPGVQRASTDYRDILNDPNVDAVYCAVPHHLHEQMYVDTIEAGKHLLGEKPFGIDRAANARICDAAARRPELVVRCVSQWAFFPGAQRIVEAIREKRFGQILEVEVGFLHSSDLDPEKKLNWKRVVEFNGEYGCMGDLGMHVLHIPLRARWRPLDVRAILSNIRPQRRNDAGEWVACDTWDNATLLCRAQSDAGEFPMTIKCQRIAPGQMNTWYIRVIGEKHCAEFSLKQPRTLRSLHYTPGGEQVWREEDLGYKSVYPAISAGIFEFGFADAIQQMFAAFSEQVARGNDVELPFGCITPEETREQHAVFTAALESQRSTATVPVEYGAV